MLGWPPHRRRDAVFVGRCALLAEWKRVDVRFGSDSEKLAMSTMGPLCPEQLTQEETLDEVCVGPTAGIAVKKGLSR
jgi:hypothetical protein